MRLTIAISLAMLTASVPAFAQDSGNEKVNAVIVYGQDDCPKPVGDEITICARKPEAERYRIPQALRETPSTKSESWNSKVLAYERVGKTGIQSCSAAGPGGSLGCTQKLIRDAFEEKKNAGDPGFAAIVEAERAKRIATIDGDAAAAQARVEAVEKEIEAKKEAEEAAKAATAAPPPPK